MTSCAVDMQEDATTLRGHMRCSFRKVAKVILIDGLKPPTTYFFVDGFPACSSFLLSVGCKNSPFFGRKISVLDAQPPLLVKQ